jgi:hypothetical protein
MDENKNIMINNIKEWLKLDNDISKLSNELKDKKKNKKQMTDELIKTMKEQNVECFNINGGSLLYKNITSKKPLNKKIIYSSLQDYFKNNNTNVDEIVKYIMENRELQEKETIKRKII